jgi:hypothetical protein
MVSHRTLSIVPPALGRPGGRVACRTNRLDDLLDELDLRGGEEPRSLSAGSTCVGRKQASRT